MKRNRISRVEADEVGGMDISSLVDICFLLLIYFIVTTTIVPREADLSMGPPAVPTGVPAPIDALTISINASGQVFSDEGFGMVALDDNAGSRDLPLLEDRLRMYQQGASASGQKCLVVIDADDEVSTQRVVDVLNTLAGLEISNVTFRDTIEE